MIIWESFAQARRQQLLITVTGKEVLTHARNRPGPGGRLRQPRQSSSCDLFNGQAEEFDPPAPGRLSQALRDATRAITNVNPGSAALTRTLFSSSQPRPIAVGRSSDWMAVYAPSATQRSSEADFGRRPITLGKPAA
jgi:hypothetical protein